MSNPSFSFYRLSDFAVRANSSKGDTTADIYRDEQIIQEQRELQRTTVTGSRRAQSLQESLVRQLRWRQLTAAAPFNASNDISAAPLSGRHLLWAIRLSPVLVARA